MLLRQKVDQSPMHGAECSDPGHRRGRGVAPFLLVRRSSCLAASACTVQIKDGRIPVLRNVLWGRIEADRGPCRRAEA